MNKMERCRTLVHQREHFSNDNNSRNAKHYCLNDNAAVKSPSAFCHLKESSRHQNKLKKSKEKKKRSGCGKIGRG